MIFWFEQLLSQYSIYERITIYRTSTNQNASHIVNPGASNHTQSFRGKNHSFHPPPKVLQWRQGPPYMLCLQFSNFFLIACIFLCLIDYLYMKKKIVFWSFLLFIFDLNLISFIFVIFDILAVFILCVWCDIFSLLLCMIVNYLSLLTQLIDKPCMIVSSID